MARLLCYGVVDIQSPLLRAGCGAGIAQSKSRSQGNSADSADRRWCVAVWLAARQTRPQTSFAAIAEADCAGILLRWQRRRGTSRPIERRQLSVLFCDLVGSTALSARLDPEDFSAIIADYRRCISETIASLDGFVARHHGDGAVVFFGYPQAHEDDAERAVQASLALVQAVAALPTNEKLSARVGVATGVALVGDMSDSAISEEHGILGDTPNLAARLQSLAQPGAVIISGRTKTIAGSQFEYRDLGKVEIKGLVEPVAAWQVTGRTTVTSRSHALASGNLLPLIGRDEELELLLRRWELAKSGEGQVVLLSGEAGIGKSRLTVALLEQLAREPHIRLRYFCSPQHTDSALYPVIGQMLRAAGFAHDDSPQAKTDKLDALLAQSSTPPQDAALFAEMLSLPNDGRYPAVEVEPQLRRQKTLKALGSHIEALARINPVLMIFEDAHWTDPTSLEFFARAVDLAVSHRLLILVTFRPEFSPPWIGRPHVTALTLNRLARRDINSLIEGVVGNRSLPAGIRQDIIERTDGIPLFVEEMTKAVLDAEGESDAQRTFAGAPTPVVAVPASLQASLMSRLDRLGPAKDVAQVGAAIGREFPHMLLAALVRQAEGGIGLRPRPADCGGFVVSTGHPAACELPVQACAGAGRGLQYAAAGAEARAACAHRRNPRKPVCGNRREPARTAGASLHEGRPDREVSAPVGQGGTAVTGTLGAGRSGRTAWPALWRKLRPCPARPTCGASRSSCKSRF